MRPKSSNRIAGLFFFIHFLPEASANHVTLGASPLVSLPVFTAPSTARDRHHFAGGRATQNDFIPSTSRVVASIWWSCWSSMGSRLDANSQSVRKRIETRTFGSFPSPAMSDHIL